MRNNTFEGLELRPEIAQSWSRAAICGLTPATVYHTEDHTVDPDGPFARTAFPVLDRLRDMIGDGRFAFMLTDRTARLIRTVYTDSSLSRAMSSMGAEVGTVWSEERTGTNALATPFATHRPIFIHGDEHFVVPMKRFSCYGAPIFDPVTGRVEGVLDIMMDAPAESPLMVPVVDQAIRNIQWELEQSRTDTTRELVAAFTRASSRTSRPVIAYGPDLLLNNPAATGLFTTPDMEQLRAAATSVSEGATTSFTLQNGSDAKVTVSHRSSAGTVLTIRTTDRAPIPRGSTRPDTYLLLQEAEARARATERSVIVVGEAGTGRSTVAHAAVAGRPVHEVNGATIDPERARWELLDHLDNRDDTVLLVEDSDLLPDETLSLLAELARSSATRLVATYDPTGRPPNTAFLGRFANRIDTRPLRELRYDLPGVVRAIKPHGSHYQFDVPAMKAMVEYGWPGNLVELQASLTALASVASTRVIRFSDLPLHIRQGTQRSFTPWQRASRDAILHALEVSHDNKSHAAEFLGISRSSLYHHMKELDLS
ncbi:sigma-54-dependent Fis family transcriptional regulator [Gordonia sp. NPDC003376]